MTDEEAAEEEESEESEEETDNSASGSGSGTGSEEFLSEKSIDYDHDNAYDDILEQTPNRKFMAAMNNTDINTPKKSDFIRE